VGSTILTWLRQHGPRFLQERAVMCKLLGMTTATDEKRVRTFLGGKVFLPNAGTPNSHTAVPSTHPMPVSELLTTMKFSHTLCRWLIRRKSEAGTWPCLLTWPSFSHHSRVVVSL
jgi:hypothetical protein